MKLIFCLQMNVKGFFKLLLSFYVCVTRHTQITQDSKFAVSLQYLKKELSDEVDFLHADKHESLLQIDSMILMGIVKHSQSSQNSKFPISLQYLRKKVEGEVDFLLVIFLQCIKKNCCNCFVLYCDAKQIFYRGPVMFIVTCCSWRFEKKKRY